ncbi:MAG: hypothetical protein FWB85_04840 [Chitinispirillia bacterium]|nr:hypothetical protein [Chitinispirillia bacterium]MCL2242100.1 hypothetical protein [Chitinispirillia bacterium]
MSIFLKRIARAAVITAVAAAAGVGAGSLSDRVDSLSGTVDDLEAKVRSTLMSGGSSPVSFAGESRVKMQYHNLGFDAPGYMLADRSYLQSGWEGNENIFRLGMVVQPGRNTVLWSKIGFQSVFTGNHHYSSSDNGSANWPDGLVPYQYRHDKGKTSLSIHEDMSAGMAVRTQPASFWVRLGNTMWTEASPLTVWKSQPRTFAWEYLPFEVEQPIARYYEYNIAKGEKSGRAAWNKKPFNGINVESINLPYDLYANFVYGTFERFDNFEREYVDFAGDLGYADGYGLESPPFKSHGIGDSYRHVIHGRLAKSKMFGDMTLGLNYVGIDYKDDVIRTGKLDDDGQRPVYYLLREFRGNDSVFVKEPKTISVDLRGPAGRNFSMHADVAVNWTDTVWYIDPVAADNDNPDFTGRHMNYGPADGRITVNRQYHIRAHNPDWYSERAVSTSGINLAAYIKLNYTGVLPAELDLAWISPDFYSPFSFATPVDAFYAFGSNMVGAGKFIARGEGSPYTQNMTGANFTFNPTLPGYGHLRVKYGHHMNINEEGRDLLFFPYRLNGSDMFTLFHSSYNRWGNGLIDNSVRARAATYKGRLGDESFWHISSFNTNADMRQVAGPGAGGLRSDFLSMMEGFVPYKDAAEAYRNFASRIPVEQGDASVASWLSPAAEDFFKERTTITNQSFEVFGPNEAGDTVLLSSTNTSWVPVSRKHTFNLEFDAAYDIGPLIGYKKDLFVGGYAGLQGVTRGFSGSSLIDINGNGENTLLWSLYARLEPAWALHKNFYLLGLLGYENWRAQDSWMMLRYLSGAVLHPDVLRNPTTGVGLLPGQSGLTAEDVFVKVPIDYQDWALGLGFDWDMLERVGLHGRVKWMSHTDKGLNDFLDGKAAQRRDLNAQREAAGEAPLPDINTSPANRNDWATWVVSLELKTWF